MTPATVPQAPPGQSPRLFQRADIAIPALGAVALLVIGLTGGLTEAWGYALFILAGFALLAGAVLFGMLLLTRSGDSDSLQRGFKFLFIVGGWGYLYAIAAFAGFFTYETFQGRMELRWILFGPAILAALIVLDFGLYRRLVQQNLPTWRRYRHFITREASDPEAMRKTLLQEVVLHKSLLSVSRFRWLRHTLIFWGFMLMFFTELAAVLVREAFPAFGLRHIWAEQDHPVRLAFDFAFDLFGLMVLAGCVMALVWRVMVNGTEQQKFTDTPSAAFLLFVVASGFVVEGMRIAGSPPDPLHAVSFAGYAASAFIPRADWLGSATYELLWLVHVLGSCLFIAYVPVKRLIHSCATPMGRLMNSQKGLLAAKKFGVMKGLLAGKNRQPWS